jgi:hypothetical protein
MTQIVRGIVTRGNGNWIASTQGLPDGKQAMAVGKTWKQMRAMLQNGAEMTLALPPGSVALDLKLDDRELQGLVDEVKRTRGVLRDAQFEAGAAMGHAARALTREATVRDVAEMLGCSFQQVSKLAPKGKAEEEPGDTPEDWAKMLYVVAGVRELATTEKLAREAREWSTKASPFPEDPAFIQEVAREHRAFIDRIAREGGPS